MQHIVHKVNTCLLDQFFSVTSSVHPLFFSSHFGSSYGDPRNDVASNDVASQLVVRGMVVNLTPPKTSSRVVKIRLGNYNVGIMQNQFETDRALRKVMHKLNSVIHKCVIVGEIDMMSMCEVGGHGKGMPAVRILPETHLPVLRAGHGQIAYCNMQNYMSCWNFNVDASQLGLQQIRPPVMHRLAQYGARCDPRLLVQIFSKSEHSRDSTFTAKLVQGNLHIRTPNEGPTPSIVMRKRILLQALLRLLAAARLETERSNDDASQPVVCVLLGDPNLSKSQGEEAVQQLQLVEEPQWDHSYKPGHGKIFPDMRNSRHVILNT
jgi:hypothetical protein